MALYPPARKRLITPGANDPRIIPIGIIYHVDAGNASSLYEYFRDRSGGVESHFHIQKDGDIEQYRDTKYEADANWKGNSFVRQDRRLGFISVETQGFEHGEWTEAQLDSMVDIALWGHDEHGIPMRICPDWDKAGLSYHVMFGAPGPWTPVAKTCPGPERVLQWRNVFIPRVLSAFKSRDWFTMSSQQDLEKAIRKVLNEPLILPYNYKTDKYDRPRASILNMIRWTHKRSVENFVMLGKLQGLDEQAIAEHLNRLDAQEVAEAVATETAERMQE